MSTVLAPPVPDTSDHGERPPEHTHVVNYLNVDYGLKSWLLTVDHKRIGILYLVSVTLFFLIGGAAAVLFRVELMTPDGEMFQSETYNKLFTMHGVVMIFFFLIPAVPGVLGNFLVPLMIGARDMAFPRLNLASWYLFMIGGLASVVVMMIGGVDTGWTFYTPYSSTYANTYVMATAVAVFITGFSSILTGLNIIVTVHKLRAPGMSWFRLPLFVWSHYAASLIMVLGTPVLAVTIVLVALERGSEATRCCSSTCSGSTPTRPSIS
jgi:cytochrome c oxidase subunit I